MRIKTAVGHYGICEDPSNGVLWLIEGGECHNSVGLPLKKSSFVFTKNLKRTVCPHNLKPNKDFILTEEEANYLVKINSVLLEAFNPFNLNPKGKYLYIVASGLEEILAITRLQNIVNPTTSLNLPVQHCCSRIESVRKLLQSSNLVNFLVTNIEEEDIQEVKILMRSFFSNQSRLIFSGEQISRYSFNNVVDFVPFDAESVNAILGLEKTDFFRRLGHHLTYKYLRKHNAEISVDGLSGGGLGFSDSQSESGDPP